MDAPKVIIGIVTFNSLADLPRCLEAIYAQTYRNFAVIVADNASSDGTCAWLQSSGYKLKVISNVQNLGFAQAHNKILNSCVLPDESFYMPLNPDVVLGIDYISSLVSLMREKGAGWATGKLLLPDSENQPLTRIYSTGHALQKDGYAFNIGHQLPDRGQLDDVREVFGAPGAAPLLSQALIASLTINGSLFDEDIFMYAEDSDLDWRARRAGWRCWYTPRAVAYHRGSHASGKSRDMALGNRYLSVIKNAYPIDLALYNLPIILAHLTARLVITPARGFWLIRYIVSRVPSMWRKRQKPHLPRSAILSWFAWSKGQPTGQPTTSYSRFRSFLSFRLHHKNLT